jgi:hypothetical protein
MVSASARLRALKKIWKIWASVCFAKKLRYSRDVSRAVGKRV